MTRDGYADPTAEHAIRNVMRENRQKVQRNRSRYRKSRVRVWHRITAEKNFFENGDKN